MGEIDTNPIEPVQVAVTLFGERSQQKKHRAGSSSSSGDEMEKERDFEGLQKDLANYKVRMEAKDAAYLQLLHQLERFQKTAEELSAQLKNSEVERDVYLEECRAARFRIDEMEATARDMADQLLEIGKLRDQLSHVLGELKGMQGELLSMETELAAARDEKLKALTQAELMETAADMEKERAGELLKRVIDLNETIFMLKKAALKAEKEKDGEILELAAETKLENQLRAKSAFIDSLQVELNQANELLSSSNKVVSDIMDDLNRLKADLKEKEKEISHQAIHIEELETEMNQLKLDLKKANDEVTGLNCEVEMVTDELDKVKTEMEEMKARENEAPIEIALLKAELLKGRSKLAVAEARAGNVKPVAVQQVDMEAEQEKETNAEPEKRRDENFQNITISLEEYESLIRKAEKTNQSPRNDNNQLAMYELENLKKELKVAMTKVAEFRTRTEQAVTRAEAAERAKLALEDQLRKWREQKQRRKAALAALREESLSREFGPSSSYDNKPTNYQPLGKVLNMKF